MRPDAPPEILNARREHRTRADIRMRFFRRPQLYTKKQEAESGRRNRWNCVKIVCPQAGSPRARARVEDESARRNSSSEKVSPD